MRSRSLKRISPLSSGSHSPEPFLGRCLIVNPPLFALSCPEITPSTGSQPRNVATVSEVESEYVRVKSDDNDFRGGRTVCRTNRLERAHSITSGLAVQEISQRK